MTNPQPPLPDMPDQAETVALLRAEVWRLTRLIERTAGSLQRNAEEEGDSTYWADELRQELAQRAQPMGEVWRQMNDGVRLIEEAQRAQWAAEKHLRELRDVEAFAGWLNRTFGTVFNLQAYGKPYFNRYAALEEACQRVSKAFPDEVEGDLRWTLKAVRDALAMPVGPGEAGEGADLPSPQQQGVNDRLLASASELYVSLLEAVDLFSKKSYEYSVYTEWLLTAKVALANAQGLTEEETE